MQQNTPESTGGPTLWWIWAEIKGEFAELRALGLANRHMVLDQVTHLQQRQDDMRREQLYHIKLLSQRLDLGKKKSSSWAWLAHIPWDRIVVFLAGALGALGWIKPQWLKMMGLP